MYGARRVRQTCTMKSTSGQAAAGKTGVRVWPGSARKTLRACACGPVPRARPCGLARVARFRAQDPTGLRDIEAGPRLARNVPANPTRSRPPRELPGCRYMPPSCPPGAPSSPQPSPPPRGGEGEKAGATYVSSLPVRAVSPNGADALATIEGNEHVRRETGRGRYEPGRQARTARLRRAPNGA